MRNTLKQLKYITMMLCSSSPCIFSRWEVGSVCHPNHYTKLRQRYSPLLKIILKLLWYLAATQHASFHFISKLLMIRFIPWRKTKGCWNLEIPAVGLPEQYTLKRSDNNTGKLSYLKMIGNTLCWKLSDWHLPIWKSNLHCMAPQRDSLIQFYGETLWQFSTEPNSFNIWKYSHKIWNKFIACPPKANTWLMSEL